MGIRVHLKSMEKHKEGLRPVSVDPVDSGPALPCYPPSFHLIIVKATIKSPSRIKPQAVVYEGAGGQASLLESLGQGGDRRIDPIF